MGTRKVLEEMRELRREIRDLHSENRDMLRFTGEVVRRNEIAFHDMSTVMGELREESRAAAAASRASAAASRESAAASHASVEETRAQTKAIFALIDRLQGGGAAPAT